MRYLLDTHIFLWWLNDDKRLHDSAVQIITHSQNQVCVSIVNAWEISIKHRSGKLLLKTTLRTCFEVSGFEVLSIGLDHIFELDRLPFHHKDPFDRLLIAQAKTENLTLITSDEKIGKYNVPLLRV